MTGEIRPAQQVDTILFGAAYYDEYMPIDRLETDMQMMQSAAINTIRIAESTWATLEPQPGVYNFEHIDRVIESAGRHGISVIIGTPTYALPSWLVALQPDLIAPTAKGQRTYGARQIMDIVHPTYRQYCQELIEHLVTHVADQPSVIGYQVDNESKYYDSVSPMMQRLFVKHLREIFHDDLEAMNREFGLDYWSNRVDAWEDFPDISATINASMGVEFDKFRRSQVAQFLDWQAGLVRQHSRPDQFVTHNFDLDWKGHSYGIQPQVDHFQAARCLDIAGVDIYHPSEDDLTGKEIAFGGDLARSLKDGANYLVLETQAQGQHGWLPYPGQLRLQAYSHLASGADGVMYWHWHSIHNSFESYWKGLLSHDFETNPTFDEAGSLGRELADQRVSPHLIHLQKSNRVAIMVSNESLTALQWFSLETGFPADSGSISYNDIVRLFYDALFDLNIECDIVSSEASCEQLSQYALVITPALYSTTDATLEVLAQYVREGGHLFSTVRSFVADQYLQIWHDRAPHGLTAVFGMSYNQFTKPEHVGLVPKGTLSVRAGENSESTGSDRAECDPEADTLPGNQSWPESCRGLIELVKPDAGTEILASYLHPVWDQYAALTGHKYGEGEAYWLATLPKTNILRQMVAELADRAGVFSPARKLAGTVSVREGFNQAGEHLIYMFNYSPQAVTLSSPYSGQLILGGQGHLSALVDVGDELTIDAWDLALICQPAS